MSGRVFTRNIRSLINCLYSDGFTKSGPATFAHNFLKLISIGVGSDLHSVILNLSNNFTMYFPCERKISPGLCYSLRPRKSCMSERSFISNLEASSLLHSIMRGSLPIKNKLSTYKNKINDITWTTLK